ncbi:hypothetical protein EDC01DRAFT_784767 [Geopyxis carbonaria]|nr:hypothetical protein EDC01DRAFT_784767 [Geopyxis carbonaria]
MAGRELAPGACCNSGAVEYGGRAVQVRDRLSHHTARNEKNRDQSSGQLKTPTRVASADLSRTPTGPPGTAAPVQSSPPGPPPVQSALPPANQLPACWKGQPAAGGPVCWLAGGRLGGQRAGLACVDGIAGEKEGKGEKGEGEREGGTEGELVLGAQANGETDSPAVRSRATFYKILDSQKSRRRIEKKRREQECPSALARFQTRRRTRIRYDTALLLDPNNRARRTLQQMRCAEWVAAKRQ